MTMVNTQIILTDLPEEILLHICSFLDSHAAIQLSQTARRLQQPAESKVWETVCITQRDIIASSRSPPLGGQEDHDLSLSPSSGELSSSVKRHDSAWALSLLRLVRRLDELTGANKWRRFYLRELDLDLRQEIPVILIELLTKLTGLTVLRVRFPSARASRPVKLPGFITSLELLQRLCHSPLYRLRRVHLNVNSDWHSHLYALLHAAPNLETLQIETAMLNNTSLESPPLNATMIPSLLKLTALSISELHPSFCTALAAIVRASPRLHSVALKDQAMHWRPNLHDPLLDALAGLTMLRKLEVTSCCYDMLSKLEGWTEVEELGVTWGRSALDEKGLQGDIIPPLPNLRQYHIDTSLYADQLSLQLSHRAPPHTAAISALLKDPSALWLAPSLTIIHTSSHMTYGRYRLHHEDIPLIPDHTDPSFQGIIVYQYHSSSGADLLHCRIRITDEGQKCSPIGTKRRRPTTHVHEASPEWADVAWYNGREVLPDLVNCVLGIDGIRIRAVEPNRRLKLSKPAWDVLETWARREQSWS
ncbi:hypothetical protein IAU60_006528 [Kwoniella sp. DSM 27419]